MNPYLTLNLPPEATDAEIRNAYLQLVKRYTPTHAPKEFAEIAKAYALIDTPDKRLQFELHGPAETGAPASLCHQSLEHLRLHRPRPQWSQLCETFSHNT